MSPTDVTFIHGSEALAHHRDRRIYWVTTAVVCSVMLFSAINFNLDHPLGPMRRAFAHLGLPSYFKLELPIATVLGVFALAWPNVPGKVRDFAYSGFVITLVSASIAHFSVGDSALFVVDPLIFLLLRGVSYRFAQKTKEYMSPMS